MNKFIKTVSVLLILMVAIPSWAQNYDFEVDNVYYRVIPRTHTLEVCGVAPEAEDVVIPQWIKVSVSGEEPILFEVVRTVNYAFRDRTALKSVKLPNSLPGIEQGTFSGCTNLENVELCPTIEYIKKNAFYNTAIEVLTIPATYNDIEYHPGAFAGMNKLKKLIFEDCKHYIYYDPPKPAPWESDKEVNIEKLYLPELEEIYMGGGISFISFAGCPKVTKLTLGNMTRSIGEYFMEGCTNLKSVITGDKLHSIGRGAFKNCTSLERVVLGKNFNGFFGPDPSGRAYYLTGCDVFEGCSSLKYLECNADPVPNNDLGFVDERNFTGVDVNTCVLVVPKRSVDVYKNTYPWYIFKNIKGKDSDVGIEEVAEDGTISIEGGSLISAKDSVSVSVYSVDGRQVASRVLSQGESLELPARGIYIVVANGKSRKIVY